MTDDEDSNDGHNDKNKDHSIASGQLIGFWGFLVARTRKFRGFRHVVLSSGLRFSAQSCRT